MINLLQAVHNTMIRLINYFALSGHTMKAQGEVPAFKVWKILWKTRSLGRALDFVLRRVAHEDYH